MGIDKLQQEFQEISQTTRASLSLNPTLSNAAIYEKSARDTSSAPMIEKGIMDFEISPNNKTQENPQPFTELPEVRDTFESRVAAAKAKGEDANIDRKRAESAALAWGGAESDTTQQDSTAAGKPRRLEDMSMAELEHELHRRKTLIQAIEDLNT